MPTGLRSKRWPRGCRGLRCSARGSAPLMAHAKAQTHKMMTRVLVSSTELTGTPVRGSMRAKKAEKGRPE